MPQFNRRELDVRAREYGFNRDTFEKVLRLRTILDFLNTHEYIPHFSTHVLRHTFATRCIEGGMKPKTLQKILGHSNIGITMNLYVHITEDEKQREIDLVADALKVI